MDCVQFPCPSCRQQHQLPATAAGQHFRCPACQYVGTIPTVSQPNLGIQASPPAPVPGPSPSGDVFGVELNDLPPPAAGPDPRWFKDETLDPSRPRKRSRRRSGESIEGAGAADPASQRRIDEQMAGWQKVRWGINLVYFALMIWVGTVALTVLTFCLMPILMGGPTPGTPRASPETVREARMIVTVVTLLLMGVGLLVNVMQLVGYGLCLFVPSNRGGALAWAVVAAVLTLLSLGLAIVGVIVPAVPLLALFVGLAGWVAFLLFLRAVGLELDVTWLVQDIQGVLSLTLFGLGPLGLVMVGLSVVFALYLGPGRRPDAAGALPLACGVACVNLLFVIMLFVVLLRYLNLLRDTAAQIEEELALRVQPLTGRATRRLRDY